MICATACANKNEVLDVQDLLSVCHSSHSTEGCQKFNGTKVSIKGYLDNGGYYNKPVLVPSASIIQKYDRDSLEDIYAIEFLVSDISREQYSPYLNQNVIITGEIFTQCVEKAVEMRKFNEQQLQSSKDEIIVRMLTGTCHYVTNPYMLDVEISKSSHLWPSTTVTTNPILE